MTYSMLIGAGGEAIIQRAIQHLESDTLPSIAALDRRLMLGYSMATEILNELERRGIVSKVQADGDRRYLGEGQKGREAFKKLAAELNAGIEPAARWWRNLSAAKRRKYLPGVNEAAQWADLTDADKRQARSVYFRNLARMRALRVEFEGLGVAA